MSWDDDLIAELVATGAVDSVDFKGLYEGTLVDQPADPALYTRVIEAFPDAWIEDPKLTPEIDALLEPHRDRITWDANIHSIADIEALPFAPRMVNLKPSRLGGIKPLFDAYDYTAERGIGAYGGGQFELGVGRGHIQYLASIFHPDTPNDTSPTGFHVADPPPGLDSSPLAAEAVGDRLSLGLNRAKPGTGPGFARMGGTPQLVPRVAALQAAPSVAVAAGADAAEEHEHRGDDRDDGRQADDEADPVDECSEQDCDQNSNHVMNSSMSDGG